MADLRTAVEAMEQAVGKSHWPQPGLIIDRLFAVGYTVVRTVDLTSLAAQNGRMRAALLREEPDDDAVERALWLVDAVSDNANRHRMRRRLAQMREMGWEIVRVARCDDCIPTPCVQHRPLNREDEA